MLVYVFPGQGAQKRGMGADLFEQFSEQTSQANDILGYAIQDLCLKDNENRLNQTQFTQPALYVVNALTYLKTIADTGLLPDYVAGHSLGEYSALFAAQAFDFETGLKLVQKRGELMSQAAGGGMAAVLGLKRQELTHILEEHELTTVSIANYNSYEQSVLSGPQQDIEQTKHILSNKAGVTYIPLSVSGAFHSSYMLSAQQAFANFLNGFEFKTPTLPVIANVNAKPYHPAIIKSNLTNQITQPVEWTQTIEYLSGKDNVTYQEIGPGHVLTNLIKRIQNKQ